jgi:hypothetical protein
MLPGHLHQFNYLAHLILSVLDVLPKVYAEKRSNRIDARVYFMDIQAFMLNYIIKTTEINPVLSLFSKLLNVRTAKKAP